MIATLNGTVAEKLAEIVVLNVQGVGYGIMMPLEDYSAVHTGDQVKVYVYEHIREASHDLYGFRSTETKELFELLLSVNGVGPKMAIGILTIGSNDDVRRAIASNDAKFITAAPGVGKRVAERVILDLKDKVGVVSVVGSDAMLIGAATAQQDEAVQGLVALGYSVQDAMTALGGIDKLLSAEDRIRQALQGSAS